MKNPHNYVNDQEKGYWNKARLRAAAAKSAQFSAGRRQQQQQQPAPAPALDPIPVASSSSSAEEDEKKRLALHRAYVVGQKDGSPRRGPKDGPAAKRLKLRDADDAF